MSEDIREQLAALSHEQWSGWMRYLFSRCEPSDSGVISPSAIARWTRQMNTPYAELTEQEKNSDREEADKMLAIIGVMDGE